MAAQDLGVSFDVQDRRAGNPRVQLLSHDKDGQGPIERPTRHVCDVAYVFYLPLFQKYKFLFSDEPSSDNLLRSKSLDDLQQTKKPMFSLASSMFETVACHPILLIFVLNAALERLFRSPLLSPILYKLGRKLLKKRSA